ncbi:nephrin-like isoform X2 [Ornithodoros turicata]|uniref:nephrin-like isoform X2 n=1 Tax=Ornithodoros turicata TaxID=34597 RepID=UPI0031390DB6
MASIVYTGVVRGKVALPCDIRPPSSDDSVTLVLWYKDESLAPIYTLDSRRGQLDQARQSSLPELEDRAFFNMDSEPAFLQIDPVEEGDAGEYRCRVDFRKGRSINTVINLKVVVPPGDPVILDKNGYRMEGLAGRFNEGEHLRLICEVEGGKPRPVVSWWKDKRLVDNNFTVIGDGRLARNVLEIDQLKRSDFLSVLTCQGANNNSTVSVSRSITLDMNLLPLDVAIQPPKEPLSADKEVELVCTSSGSRPPALLTWWKGGQQLISSKEHQVQEGVTTSSSIIQFTPRIEDSGQILSCRAENQFIPGSAIEEGWKLDVLYAPKVSVQLGQNLKLDDIQESNDVYLECLIDASPPATEITWLFGESEVTTNISDGVIVSSQSLVLQKVHRSRGGSYKCSAINREGRGTSKDFTLRVKFAPICKAGQRVTYGVSPGESVSVHCELEADPSDVRFQWRFNTSAASGKRHERISYSHVFARSTAVYTPQTEEDYGELLCWGANDVGKQRRPCSFSIIKAGPPDPVSNCTQLNATEDSVFFECTEGRWDGGISPVTFVAEMYNIYTGRLQANGTSVGSPTFAFIGLPAGSSFNVVVYSVNAKGRKTPTNLIVNTLRPAEKLTAGYQAINIIRPVLGALVGVVVTLLIAAIAIIIFIKFKHQKRTKDHRKERNDEKSQTLLTKDTEDFPDFEERGPDIIPSTPLNKPHFTPTYQDVEDIDHGFTRGSLSTFYSLPPGPKRSTAESDGASSKLSNINEVCDATYGEFSTTAASLSGTPSSASSTMKLLRNVPPKLPPSQFSQIDFHRSVAQRPLPTSHEILATVPHSPDTEEVQTVLCGDSLQRGNHMESTV